MFLCVQTLSFKQGITTYLPSMWVANVMINMSRLQWEEYGGYRTSIHVYMYTMCSFHNSCL